MKKLRLTLVIISLIIFSSCGKDDTVEIVNELLFDGTSLVGENGVAVDLGSSGDHYGFSFAISDGSIDYVSSSTTFQFETGSDFFLAFGAESLGTDQFKTGNFEFRSVIDDVPDTNYFFNGTFVDIGNSSILSVTAGTVTISGTSPDFTIQFDVTLTGGKKLTGAFVGTFELQ